MRRISLVLSAAICLVIGTLVPHAGARSAGGTGETSSYVVLYAEGASSAAGRQAVKAAGGTLTNENSAIGLAEAVSSSPTFLHDVRRQAAVKGAARNRSIATARPGMGHKFADERLEE